MKHITNKKKAAEFKVMYNNSMKARKIHHPYLIRRNIPTICLQSKLLLRNRQLNSRIISVKILQFYKNTKLQHTNHLKINQNTICLKFKTNLKNHKATTVKPVKYQRNSLLCW